MTIEKDAEREEVEGEETMVRAGRGVPMAEETTETWVLLEQEEGMRKFCVKADQARRRVEPVRKGVEAG